MLIEGSLGGTMSCFMKDLYADKLWKHRPGCFFQQLKSLLIMDSAKSHLVDVPDHFKGYNTEVKIINAGMTPLLQFIDIHINKSFKNKLREKGLDGSWYRRIHQKWKSSPCCI